MDDTNFSGLPVGGRRLTVVISQLQHAVAAADHGSFRQAADVLSIEQSTLSVLSNYFEHSIGVVIFERSSGGVRATPAGRHFLRMPRSILEQIEALIASTRPNGSDEAGHTTLWSERILVVLPGDHPLAARQVIYWTDLRDQTVCLARHLGSCEQSVTKIRNACDRASPPRRAQGWRPIATPSPAGPI
jgi:DNA-binding transcriptional LysR family regulator